MYPLVFCLTSRKTKEIYVQIFNQLKAHAGRLGLEFSPQRIVLDFEIATMRAIQEVMPYSEIGGCLFHWGQTVWRKIAELGLKRRYQTNVEIQRSVHIIQALPFLPLDDLVKTFVGLRNEIHEDVIPIWNYIDHTWVRGTPSVGRRRARGPIFHPILWNVHQACINKQQRTNNCVEAWHSKFAKLLHSHHVNVWKFLEQIKKEQRDNSQQFLQMLGGHRNIRHSISKLYITNQRFVEQIVGNYEYYKSNEEVNLYLRAISYRLKTFTRFNEEDDTEEEDEETEEREEPPVSTRSSSRRGRERRNNLN